MKVIRHDHKFMQKIFLFRPVLEHDFNEQAGNLFYLEQASFFQPFAVMKYVDSEVLPRCGIPKLLPQRLKPQEL